MFSKTVNLCDELALARRNSQDAMMLALKDLLLENDIRREKIKKALQEKSTIEENLFDFDLLDGDKIFHIDHIRKVCIDYRLRFLDSSMFKNSFPPEAISKIRELETRHDIQLGGFRIIAPTKAFHLLNYNDPLLFAPMGNEYYYLVHKWGDDLKTSRKWLVWPFRNIGTFTLTCLLISVFVTLLFPLNKLSRHIPMATVIVFLFAFKSIFAVLMYGFFMGGRKFNAQMWNSKYYNS